MSSIYLVFSGQRTAGREKRSYGEKVYGQTVVLRWVRLVLKIYKIKVEIRQLFRCIEEFTYLLKGVNCL
jgi:hypothetical protein